MHFLINALLTVNVIVCLLIILIVLMQRPKNEGLGAAFGGGMTEGIWGAQTTNVLAKTTRWLGGLFFLLTLLLSYLYSVQPASPLQQRMKAEAAAKAAAATPAPAGAHLPPIAPAPTAPASAEATPATTVPALENPLPAGEPSGGVVPTPESAKSPTPAPDQVPAPEPASPTPATPQ